MKEEIVLFKIHRALEEGKSFYEATRAHWRMDTRRLQHIQYAVGVDRGKIVCAFRPLKWETVLEDGPDYKRKHFEGVEVSDEVLSQFQDAELKLLAKFGARKELAYASLTDID
ncbi:MAG TPA: hypothetical protein VFV52_11320 [Bacilli bacterium]|nr:hypothetical protein [Bacilli bacterium]